MLEPVTIITTRHLYLSHPQVVMDPDVPVPQWRLRDAGRARIAQLAGSGAMAGFDHIFCSTERKAVETAEILALVMGVEVTAREEFGENDRSATGYLPPEAFEAAANAFFGAPDVSHRGWETARDAQARIVEAVGAAINERPDQRLLFVGHGAVGTLLRCHLAELEIARSEDQPGGNGGCVYGFDWPRCKDAPRWTLCETLFDGKV